MAYFTQLTYPHLDLQPVSLAVSDPVPGLKIDSEEEILSPFAEEELQQDVVTVTVGGRDLILTGVSLRRSRQQASVYTEIKPNRRGVVRKGKTAC